MTSLMMIDDGEIPGKTKEEKKKTLMEWYELNLDKYYDKIENFTFKTSFIELQPKDVKNWYKYNKGERELDESWKDLLSKMEKEISKFPDGCFFRLSTRSPKDAVDKFPSRFQEYLDIHLKASMKLSEKYVTLRQAFVESMKIRTVEEALLLMSGSTRILGDFKRALDYEDVWDMKIVIREFKEFEIKNEFRGFFYDGKLTALSQYDKNIFFNIDEKKIENRIFSFLKKNEKFFETLKNSIIDFIVTDDEIYICELNPFSVSTGSALFDWKMDEKVLKNGPFEFRTLKEEKSDKFFELLLGPWIKFINDSLNRISNKKLNIINI